MASMIKLRSARPASASCSIRSRGNGLAVVATASRTDIHSTASSSSLAAVDAVISKRQLGQAVIATGAAYLLSGSPAHAGFQKELKKRKIPIEEYAVLESNGLKYYDLKVGTASDEIQKGDQIIVHWDCLYRGIDIQSSRNARLLGGNRTIAEPFSYTVGQRVYGQSTKSAGAVEGSGGLFSGQSGPKPPQALSLAAVGMKKGGKRSLIVDDSTLGYGDKGIGELPANTTFELQVEVLEVVRKV